MIGIKVRLSADELVKAYHVGAARVVNNVLAGRRPHPRDRRWVGNGLGVHVSGAIGECAVAKFLGIDWEPRTERPDEFGEPDVGIVGVRHTIYATGYLKIYPHDPDNLPMVLVTGDIDQLVYIVRGWILPKDGKKKSWLNDNGNQGRWQHAVPQEHLQPPSTIPRDPRNYDAQGTGL